MSTGRHFRSTHLVQLENSTGTALPVSFSAWAYPLRPISPFSLNFTYLWTPARSTGRRVILYKCTSWLRFLNSRHNSYIYWVMIWNLWTMLDPPFLLQHLKTKILWSYNTYWLIILQQHHHHHIRDQHMIYGLQQIFICIFWWFMDCSMFSYEWNHSNYIN